MASFAAAAASRPVFNPVTAQLKHISELIFTREILEELKRYNITTTREIYELSSPTTQCENVIGKVGDNPCYICGMDIDESDYVLIEGRLPKIKRVNLGLTSECEHLLPIAQAIILLGLYSHKLNEAKKTRIPLFYSHDDVLKLEYAWAHRTCNQIKSDIVLIRYYKLNTRFEVDTGKIENLLKNIFENSDKYVDKFKSVLSERYKDWRSFVDARIMPLSEKFQYICDYLNRFNAPKMLELLGAAKIMEGPMNPIAKELLSSHEPKKNSKFNQVLGAAAASRLLYSIPEHIKNLLAPTIRKKYVPIIEDIYNKNHTLYLNLIIQTPTDIQQYSIPYIKISILNALAKELKNTGNRQRVTIEKIVKNIITTVSNIKYDTMERFVDLEKSLAAANGAAAANRGAANGAAAVNRGAANGAAANGVPYNVAEALINIREINNSNNANGVPYNVAEALINIRKESQKRKNIGAVNGAVNNRNRKRSRTGGKRTGSKRTGSKRRKTYKRN